MVFPHQMYPLISNCSCVYASYYMSIPVLLLFVCPAVSDSLQPHELQHTRLPCPSSSPQICPSSYPLHWWCLPTISFSDTLFFCPQPFPASGPFPMRRLFASNDQNTEVFSISPSNRYSGLISLKIDWLISLQSKGISGVFSSITDQRHQFFNVPFQCTYWKKSTKRSSHVFNTCFMSDAFTCFNHLLDSTVRKILVSLFYRESTSRFTDDHSLTEGTYLLVAEPEFEPGLPVKPQCSHSSCPIV